MKKIIYLVGFLILFVAACKKDKPGPTPKTIAGVYKITALKANAGNAAQVDLYHQLTECQQNDTWNFQENGTFLLDGAATTTCQNEDANGTWSLNDKAFTITAQQNTTTYQLESFDGQALVLSTAGTVNGDPATYFVTFTKQ